MFAVNLGTWRIVILAALVTSGVIILSNGFGGAEVDVTTPTGSTEPTGPTGPATESPEPLPLEGQVDGVSIAVFNGTESIGLAADVTVSLDDAGYGVGQDAADAPTTGVRVTTVYYRGGPDAAQNQANAQRLANEELGGAKVRKINPEFADLVTADTDLVVVLGQDQVPT